MLADAEKAAESAGAPDHDVDLMAAVVDSDGLAVTVLSAADIDPGGRGRRAAGPRARDGGQADPLETVAERAVEQARGLGHTYVGTEHLLLAITAGPPRELAAQDPARHGA